MEAEKQKVEKLKIEILPSDFSHYDLIFKLLVLGDSDVGKSDFTFKGLKKYTPGNIQAEIGFESCNFVVKIGKDVVCLQIWDTCGQEIYKSLVSNFFRDASCALLVYSIDNLHSFEDLIYWLNNLKRKSNPDVKIILIGNNNNPKGQRQVSIHDGEQFQKENNIDLFFEKSPKTGGDSVEKIYIEAAKLLYTNYLCSKSTQKDNDVKQIDPRP